MKLSRIVRLLLECTQFSIFMILEVHRRKSVLPLHRHTHTSGKVCPAYPHWSKNLGETCSIDKSAASATPKHCIIRLEGLFKQSKGEEREREIGQQEAESMLLLNYAVFSL